MNARIKVTVHVPIFSQVFRGLELTGHRTEKLKKTQKNTTATLC